MANNMHYLKKITDKVLNATSVYKTPPSIIDKITKYDYLIQNPTWQKTTKLQ